MSLAEVDTISTDSTGETVVTTLSRPLDHDSLEDEDVGEILDDDELGDEDGEPGVLGGEHDDDDAQREDHPARLHLRPILEPAA